MIYLFNGTPNTTEPPPPLLPYNPDGIMLAYSGLMYESGDNALPMLSTIQFSTNALSVVSGGYVDKTVFGTIRSDGTMRILNAGTEVGTTAGETVHNPGTAKIYGCAYAENNVITSESYPIKIGLFGALKQCVTATEAGNLNTILTNFATNIRAV
jgi:hypothetical protein